MAFSFTSLGIPGPLLISSRIFADERGVFQELYKESEFCAQGITLRFVQDNFSRSKQGVLRGMHLQKAPHAQGKLVKVIAGRIWDAILDLRPESPQYGHYIGLEMQESDSSMLWVPPGFAHGFVVLSEQAYIHYKCTAEYKHSAEAGIRWNDPDVGIQWPVDSPCVLARDQELPLLRDYRAY